MEGMFLYTAMNNIFHNQFSLGFLAPEDIALAIQDVIQRENLTFGPAARQLALSVYVTQLIIQQRVEFVPAVLYLTTNPDEIGRLAFTTIYTVPSPKQSKFSVFKLTTIPFQHKSRPVQLHSMPAYFGCNEESNLTIEWYKDDLALCNFDIMTNCRDTPPIHRVPSNICRHQILSNQTLTGCNTEKVPPAPHFVKHLNGPSWAVSKTPNTTCVIVPSLTIPDISQQVWVDSKNVQIPPVAAINVPNESTIVCAGFNLLSRPSFTPLSGVVILHNSTFTATDAEVIDLHQHLNDNLTWPKPPFTTSE
ncbi:unnamed protein product, partial [Didymodactylos carnosus]